jgi:hypothetical protein
MVPDIWNEKDAFIFKGKQSFFLDSLHLKMETSWSFKTSKTTYPMTQSHTPEDLNPEEQYMSISLS